MYLKHHPLSAEKLTLLGEICQLKPNMRLLDLSCGRGELLVDWAQQFNITGVGIDTHEHWVADARQHAYEQDVENRINFITAEPIDYPQSHHEFDLVACLGNVTNDLSSTLTLMQTALGTRHQMLIVGEIYWKHKPDDAIAQALDIPLDAIGTLEETLTRFEQQGWNLAEMVLANQDELDRYESSRWMMNSDDMRLNDAVVKSRHNYLTYGRQYVGWGAFVLMPLKEILASPLPENRDRPVGIEFTEDMFWVRLADGRVIGNPLAWYPWLKNAEQRENYHFTAAGIEWSSLDQRLTVRQLLTGDALPR